MWIGGVFQNIELYHEKLAAKDEKQNNRCVVESRGQDVSSAETQSGVASGSGWVYQQLPVRSDFMLECYNTPFPSAV